MTRHKFSILWLDGCGITHRFDYLEDDRHLGYAQALENALVEGGFRGVDEAVEIVSITWNKVEIDPVEDIYDYLVDVGLHWQRVKRDALYMDDVIYAQYEIDRAKKIEDKVRKLLDK